MYSDAATGCSSGHGITIARSLVGHYITSLDMAGCSISLVEALTTS